MSAAGTLRAASRASIVPIALLLLTACQSLPPASLVVRTRLVGAEVEIATDHGRAWPLPGETATLTYYVLRVDPTEAISAGFTICPAGPSIGGIRLCAGQPFAVVPPAPAEVGPLAFSFTVPPAEALGASDELVALLATCAGGGMPTIDAMTMTATCDGPGRAELSTFVIQLADPEDPQAANRNPDLSDETVAIEHETDAPVAWDPPAGPAPETDCAAVAGTAAFPRIETPATGTRTFTLAFTSSASDRETFIDEDTLDGPTETRERLSFAHFVTSGELERNASTLDGTSTDDRTARVDWTTPDAMDVPAGGTTLHVWWVARDGRGGFGWMQRDACVVVGD